MTTLANMIETLDRLQSSTLTMQTATNANVGVETAGTKDGTYALIDQMIADLGTIKRSIKEEEAKIRKDLDVHMAASAAAGSTGGVDTVTHTFSTQADEFASAGIGIADNGRNKVGVVYQTAPAVLLVGARKYSENAAFNVLAYCASGIKKLRNGKHVAESDGAEKVISLGDVVPKIKKV